MFDPTKIPIEIPAYGILVVFMVMFMTIVASARDKLDKWLGLFLLAFWCFAYGFFTCMNLYSKIIE